MGRRRTEAAPRATPGTHRTCSEAPGSRCCSGEATREARGDVVPWLEVDGVRVKGRRQPVTHFTPLAEAAAKRPGFADDYRLCQLALAAWRRQDRDEAAAFATRLGAQSPGTVFEALWRQFAKRVHENGNRPMAPGWDGATAFDSK